MGRALHIIGNWKMHKSLEEAATFVSGLIHDLDAMKSLEIGLAVPYTLISTLSEKCASSSLLIGAQNMNDASEGAFTGEIAGSMLKDAGASFVILGHSERRRFFHESDHFINKKVRRALEVGIKPLLCIGETEEEKESGSAEAVLKEQLEKGLEGLKPEDLSELMIAYEPVWAIGRGKAADPEEVQERHTFIRSCLSDSFKKTKAGTVPLLYGGSVNVDNATYFLNQDQVDGLLIGSASLSLETFRQIIDDGRQLLNNR